jgi:hypothetical protein
MIALCHLGVFLEGQLIVHQPCGSIAGIVSFAKIASGAVGQTIAPADRPSANRP